MGRPGDQSFLNFAFVCPSTGPRPHVISSHQHTAQQPVYLQPWLRFHGSFCPGAGPCGSSSARLCRNCRRPQLGQSFDQRQHRPRPTAAQALCSASATPRRDRPGPVLAAPLLRPLRLLRATRATSSRNPPSSTRPRTALACHGVTPTATLRPPPSTTAVIFRPPTVPPNAPASTRA